mmetsp:Transcript_9986/g.28384  ORF Transcript_9986/g.28384 Transcript_9986/m.28384 type:complete len:225 (-) Transcript_9986:412-1086(-)
MRPRAAATTRSATTATSTSELPRGWALHVTRGGERPMGRPLSRLACADPLNNCAKQKPSPPGPVTACYELVRRTTRSRRSELQMSSCRASTSPEAPLTDMMQSPAQILAPSGAASFHSATAPLSSTLRTSRADARDWRLSCRPHGFEPLARLSIEIVFGRRTTTSISPMQSKAFLMTSALPVTPQTLVMMSPREIFSSAGARWLCQNTGPPTWMDLTRRARPSS